jgi:hypothetical protein
MIISHRYYFDDRDLQLTIPLGSSTENLSWAKNDKEKTLLSYIG